MNFGKIASDIAEDLNGLAKSSPIEIMPKEEQIRSRIYASLLQDSTYGHIAIEREYPPRPDSDPQNRQECDIWTQSITDNKDTWIEIKRCWSAPKWNNKPKEQLETWMDDSRKFQHPKLIQSTRTIIICGIFGENQIKGPNQQPCTVIRNLDQLFDKEPTHRSITELAWPGAARSKVCVTHMGIWAWEWKST